MNFRCLLVITLVRIVVKKCSTYKVVSRGTSASLSCFHVQYILLYRHEHIWMDQVKDTTVEYPQAQVLNRLLLAHRKICADSTCQVPQIDAVDYELGYRLRLLLGRYEYGKRVVSYYTAPCPMIVKTMCSGEVRILEVTGFL